MPQTMAYVARCPTCERAVVLMVDVPDCRKEHAKEIAQCIRDGYVIERMTVEEARQQPLVCECRQKEPQPVPQAQLW